MILIFQFKKYTRSRISTQHARKLINNYADSKVGKVLAADDSNGVWFPKELLLDLLNKPVQGVEPINSGTIT